MLNRTVFYTNGFKSTTGTKFVNFGLKRLIYKIVAGFGLSVMVFQHEIIAINSVVSKISERNYIDKIIFIVTDAESGIAALC